MCSIARYHCISIKRLALDHLSCTQAFQVLRYLLYKVYYYQEVGLHQIKKRNIQKVFLRLKFVSLQHWQSGTLVFPIGYSEMFTSYEGYRRRSY